MALVALCLFTAATNAQTPTRVARDTILLDVKAPGPYFEASTETAASGGDTLSFDAPLGRQLTISGWDRDSAFIITRLGDRGCPEGDVLIGAQGKVLWITVKRRADHTWAQICDVKFEVLVPRRMMIRLATGGGPVHLADLAGGIEAEVAGGGITASGLNSTMHMHVTGGAVRIRDSVLHGSIRSIAGAVVLTHVTGDVVASAANGAVVRRVP